MDLRRIRGAVSFCVGGESGSVLHFQQAECRVQGRFARGASATGACAAAPAGGAADDRAGDSVGRGAGGPQSNFQGV